MLEEDRYRYTYTGIYRYIPAVYTVNTDHKQEATSDH